MLAWLENCPQVSSAAVSFSCLQGVKLPAGTSDKSWPLSWGVAFLTCTGAGYTVPPVGQHAALRTRIAADTTRKESKAMHGQNTAGENQKSPWRLLEWRASHLFRLPQVHGEINLTGNYGTLSQFLAVHLCLTSPGKNVSMLELECGCLDHVTILLPFSFTV